MTPLPEPMCRFFWFSLVFVIVQVEILGNISGANQLFRATNFNLGHQINIQETWGILDNFTINCAPLITLLQIHSPPTPLRNPLMLIRWSQLKFAQFSRRGCFASDMFPIKRVIMQFHDHMHKNIYLKIQLPYTIFIFSFSTCFLLSLEFSDQQ